MKKQDVIQTILKEEANIPNGIGEAYAPANIALCKYWGKRNVELNLPITSSLSISLGELGTHSSISIADMDSLIIDEEEIMPEHSIAKRLFAFLDYFRTENNYSFSVKSKSTVPIGAGLASSASGFAATVRALKDLFQWELDDKKLSMLARMGSGSASRSIYTGFVEWDAGKLENGFDSIAQPLDLIWPEFRIAVLTISDKPKKIGSTEAMNRTVKESALYKSWPDKVAQDLKLIKKAIYDKNLSALGPYAESNALSMHATMLGCVPPISYFEPESISALQRTWALRKEGIEVYATMDAGPNVKFIFEEHSAKEVSNVFPEVKIINPFS